ncbi:MAG: restriction endonuclease subunit S, partial [candidate division WOR-3 bacterium]
DYINDIAIKELNLVKAEKGIILFPKSGAAIATNNRAILGIDAYIVSHLAAVRANYGIVDLYFVYYWLCNINMGDYMENIGYPSLKLSKIKQIPIPLPPLSVQRRIVAKIKEMMDEVERTRTACETQLEAVKALPSAYLRQVFESEEAKKWERKRLGEVCEVYQPRTIRISDLKKEGPFKVYGANGIIGFFDKYNHEEEEVLVTCRGSTCGAVNMSEPKSWITGNSMVVHPKVDELLKSFLYYALKFVDISKAIYGSAQPQITRITLTPVPIPLPPLSVQRRIVAELKEKMADVEKLRLSIEKQLETINALPQAILRKAFRGEL